MSFQHEKPRVKLCIDQFIVKNFHNPSIKILDETFSDHFSNYLKYFQNQNHEPNKYIFRDMSFLMKLELLNQSCNELSCALAETNLLTKINVEQSFILLQSCLSDKLNTMAPIRSSCKWIPKRWLVQQKNQECHQQKEQNV